jgi:hypothetical protein
MSFVVIRKHLVCAVLALSILAGCKSKIKNGQVVDGTYTVSAGDTVGDVKVVAAKADAFVASNRIDDAIAFLSVNMHRFKGPNRAVLLNIRGEAFLLKDNAENAVTDYMSASEADTANPTYVVNVATAYEYVPNQTNALFFAKKVMQMENATDSDRSVAHGVILRCDHTDTLKTLLR